jgi:hypothetical protein
MESAQVSLLPNNGPRLLDVPADAREKFARVPFGFGHNLTGLALFDFDQLCDLARAYERDFFVAEGAQSAGTPFYSVGYGKRTPYEALQRLDSEQHRILLKRPEQYQPRYGALMHELFAQVLQLRGGLAPGERVVRLDSSILISSAATITPFHFDPEVSFFFQIEGDKVYHLYAPSALREAELERFYWMGIVNIGQVGLAGRDPSDEHVFALRGGMGMHQPQNSPHWVQTLASKTISYVFSYETNYSRELGRTRAFNYYQRKAGLEPSPPGTRPALDRAKARFMEAAIPLRRTIGTMVHRGA